MADERTPIVPSEEVLGRLNELADEVAARGHDAGERALAQEDLVRRLRQRPRFRDQFLDEARRALEDEIDLAVPTAGEQQIDQSEVDREVAKKALARLKLPQLRRIAETRNLDPRGKEEEVIDRIVRAYDVDSSEIARLVLTNEEAREERGVADRVYPIFDDSIDLDVAEERLRLFVGRYIRTGIARWFVFEELEHHAEYAFLHGVFRTYRVDPVGEDEEFTLNAAATAANVRVRIDRGGRFVVARSGGATEARSGVTAVAKVLGLRLLGALPIETRAHEGHLMHWDHRSVFVVGFLQRELDRDGISIFNLTSAQFETGEAPSDDVARPSVRSVKFEGAHLLSSIPACELLVEGRGLVGISALVRFQPNPDESFLVPLRLSLERDHLVVLTGFGTNRPELARDVQRIVVQRLIKALGEPLKNEADLENLARRIAGRARATEPVETADIFGPKGASE